MMIYTTIFFIYIHIAIKYHAGQIQFCY